MRKHKVIRYFLYIIIFLILILLLLWFLIQLPSIQNYAKNKILNTLSEQYDAEFEIEELKIKFIDSAEASGILFKDQQGDTLLSADKLSIDIGLFSFLNKEIFIDDFVLQNSYINIYEMENGQYNYDFLIPTTENKESTDSTSSWSFGIGSTDFKNTKLNYTNSSIDLSLIQKSIEVDFNTLDIDNQIIEVDDIRSDNTIIGLSTSESNEESSVFTLPDIGWNIAIDNTSLSKYEINIKQSQSTTAIIEELELEDLQYLDGTLILDLNQLSGNYNNQIKLSNTEASLRMEDSTVALDKIKLKTSKDYINIDQVLIDLKSNGITSSNLDLLVSYSTLNIFSEYIPSNIQILKNQNIKLKANQLNYNPQIIKSKNIDLSYGDAITLKGTVEINTKNIQFANPNNISIDLKSLTTDISQLDYLLKDFSIPDSLSTYKVLTASGKASGNLKELNIDNLSISIDDILNLQATGIITDLSDKDNLSYNLNFINLETDITKLPIAKNDNIALDSLGTVSYDGTLIGNLNDIKVDGYLKSELGNLKADIQLGLRGGIDSLSYDGVLSLDDFNVGTLLKNTDLGKITLQSELKGRGLQIADNNSEFKGAISDFDFKGYKYRLININADITDGKINGQINVDDPNVKLSYDGLISIIDDNTTFDFVAQIDTINLLPLYLYQDSISLSATVESKFSLPLREDQKQLFTVSQLILSDPNEYYSEDTISLTAEKSIDSTFIKLKSSDFDISMDGRYRLMDIPSSIVQFINNYYTFDTLSNPITNDNESLHLYGNINTLKPADIILRDQLIQARNISIDTEINFIEEKISGGLSIDSLFYDDIFSKKLDLTLKNDQEELIANIDGYENEIKSVVINKISLDNILSENKIRSTLTALDKNDLPKIKLGTEIFQQDSSIFITVQDSIILNNGNWSVSNDNLITLVNGEAIFNNLMLSDDSESLSINSFENDEKELDIDFDNFNVSHFIYMLTDKESDLTGNINGNIKVKNIYEEAIYYIINLEINEMTYDSTNVGILRIDANAKPNSPLIMTELSLEGMSNHVNGGGTYNTQTTGLDFSLDVEAFELKLLDPFLTEIISDSEGSIRGNATLKGTPQKPEANGSIEFEKVVTTIVANNSRYRIDEHTVYFDNNSIDIGILDIYDQDENIATLTGNIYHNLLKEFNIDLVLETSKFTFLNTSTKDNPVFYGTVIVDAVGTIIGPPDLLNVDITATSLQGTDITISPFSAEAYLEEDYITYGSPDDFKDLTNEYLLKLAQVYPFDVNLLLDVNEKSKLTFIVDPISGDQINGSGSGNLRIKLNPDGEQEFFGTYTVNEGNYNFTYGDFITKDFKINPGGTVKFNGNPLNANLDIDAIYNVYTTTYELIKNQPSLTTDDVDASQKRTNVEVYLTLSGRLEQPEISLDIQIPELQSSSLVNPVETRLRDIRQNANELNNQVFGLILFDNFIIADNTSSGFNNFGSNLALSSISNLISNQLNNFAQNIIKGVDVNINVSSYDSQYVNQGEGGNITEVGLNVSKQLFNDRLSISATGNIDIEGDQQAEGYTSFIGDFVLDYKLTEDGRYRLRVFSKNDFDRIENENSNKNGVSLYYKKSFDAKNKK